MNIPAHQQSVTEQIKQLEQEKIRLEFFPPIHLKAEEKQRQIQEIEDRLQPLFEQLGGEYVSVYNRNYRIKDPEEDTYTEGLW